MPALLADMPGSFISERPPLYLNAPPVCHMCGREPKPGEANDSWVSFVLKEPEDTCIWVCASCFLRQRIAGRITQLAGFGRN